MKKVSLVGIIIAGILSSSATLAQDRATCAKTSEKEIAALFDRWNESLKTGSAKSVSENYVSDAILLPTLSNKMRLTDEERIDYFNKFLSKKPEGHIDSRTIRIGCNQAIDIGNYTFTFSDGSKVAARYTFTYAWNGKQWLITTHHSSAAPES
ncbi:SgcJ/EcaC family oxidoreductase [Serratia nevei]|uniref:SgcJ/EcaC family oxidoreductase n=1 Tax=Serratia nevei TaxID=2703794 RepID=UPI003F6D8996